MDWMTLPHDAWAAITTSIVALGGIIVAHISTQKKVEETKQETKTAIEEVRVLAEPTGNGFADKVTAALGRIEDRQLLADRRAERIADELAAYREQHTREHALIPHQSDPPISEAS